MNVQFLDTRVLDDTHYIDLVDLNGKLITFLMHKISAPNVFGILKQEDGDTRDTIANGAY